MWTTVMYSVMELFAEDISLLSWNIYAVCRSNKVCAGTTLSPSSYMLFNILDRYDKGRPSVVALNIYFPFLWLSATLIHFLCSERKVYR